ncbi:MAG: hypothetical protein P8J33_03830 [Pirellulaceae bacterium]|nr:hypothetical protein [Pirellulaceae bacterium]
MTEGQDDDALSGLLRWYDAIELDFKKSKDNTVRTLIVCGSKDTEHTSSMELHEMLAHSKLHVIESVNHFEAWNHNEFDDAVTEFVMETQKSK